MATLRLTGCFALTLCALALTAAAAARADHQPVIVVPGRADVPVFIDGVDASGAVVSGEWGLYRPGHGSRVIYHDPYYAAPFQRHGYYPSSGQQPRYGRDEVESVKGRRGGAESYYRAWSAQSDTSLEPTLPAREPPPVILAPEYEGRFSK